MEYRPDKKELEKYAGEGCKCVPYAVSEKCGIGEEQIYGILRGISSHVFILDSAERNVHGRYTFFGYDPTLELTCRNGTVNIKGGMSLSFKDADPNVYIRQILSENRSPKVASLPPFTGGLVGYFSFDYFKYSEPQINFDTEDEEKFCDVDLMLFDKVIVLDNKSGEIVYIANVRTDETEESLKKAELTINAMRDAIHSGTPRREEQGRLLEELKPLFDERSFCKMIEGAKRHIFDGDIFQVVLSNRLAARFEGSLFPTYAKLRKTNPSPYMFYFSSETAEIAGASPETLVKLENGVVRTYPLAGTRPRGKTDEEDKALERELLADEKELAEHNMLVDLGRNDLGKISEFGSVKVEKYMEIQRYSHVMHIGSQVCGTLARGRDAIDAISSVLPAGTLSGAPKIRACEIINEAENNKRGIYGGAIGYLAFSGEMDTCIAIRLAFKKNGRVFVRSGAGIVADSVPENEYRECINKAKAVVQALGEPVDAAKGDGENGPADR